MFNIKVILNDTEELDLTLPDHVAHWKEAFRPSREVLEKVREFQDKQDLIQEALSAIRFPVVKSIKGRNSPLSDPQTLAKAIATSESIREALESVGLRAAGGNYAQLRKFCNLYSYPIPQVDPFLQTKKAHTTIKKSWEDIFCKDSTYHNRSRMKNLLYKACVKVEQCERCGIGNEWNGEPLMLQLEHINGVYNDNRIENLKILCPNCHSQTATFSGRKRKLSSS